MADIVRFVPSAVALLALCACGPKPPANLVVISLDTVRQDHLSTYGYERPTTPDLDQLAAKSIVFEDAFSQATNTAPSHASMFTGLYPQAHGVVENGWPLAPGGPPVLAAILRDKGFRTAAYVSGYTMKSPISGLDRGFDTYDDHFEHGKRDGAATIDLALDWLADNPGDHRFFLFVHLFDANGRYRPNDDYAKAFYSEDPGKKPIRVPQYQRIQDANNQDVLHLNPYVDRYDGLILYQNDQIARLLDNLDFSNTVVLVISDHGETLGERYHSIDHGGQVFDEQIRIPLLLFAPDLAPKTVQGAVETVDLLPTLLELLDVTPQDDLKIHGRSLVPIMAGDEPGKKFIYSTAQALTKRHKDRKYLLDEDRRITTVRSDRWKLIRYPGFENDYLELYDLQQDPQEKVNIAEQHPETRDELLEELKRWEHDWALGVVPTTNLDAKAIEQMKALGYLGE